MLYYRRKGHVCGKGSRRTVVFKNKAVLCQEEIWINVIYDTPKQLENRRKKIISYTRMHSSRMGTASSSSRLLGGSASVHAGIYTHPRFGPGDLPWPDPSTSHLGEGLETPPPARPLKLFLGVGLETPPFPARPLSPPPWCGPGEPPPVNRITDTCKNITLPQLRCGR